MLHTSWMILKHEVGGKRREREKVGGGGGGGGGGRERGYTIT